MNQLYKAIDRHRIQRGLSVAKFAVEIGVPYFVAYKTLKQLTVPADYNRKPFLDYYLAHEAEICALLEKPAPAVEVTA
jgi:hypothetical protein